MIGSVFRYGLLLLALLTQTTQAATVSGRVYHDVNGNGRFDAADTPIRAVRITDGVGFARTNRQGRYRIEVQADPTLADGGRATVAICRPGGYRMASAWFRHVDEIGPTGQADFRLIPEDQTVPFTFIHATDPHVPRGGPEKFIGFRNDVQALAAETVFCILTGDLVDLSDSHSLKRGLEQFAFLAEHTRDFPVDLYGLPGNHDIVGVRDGDPNRDHTHPSHAYGAFTSVVGPLRWSFDYGPIHVVGLDFNRKKDGKWQWGIPAESLQWLEADLSRVRGRRRIFLFVHAPADWAALEPILTKYKVERIFHGHDHVERTYRRGDVEIMSSGSVAEIFGDRDRTTGYRIVRVLEEGIDSFYRPTGSEHAVYFDYPRYNTKVKPGDVLLGAFYDPQGRIEQLTVSVGQRTTTVPFRRGPVCCRFELPLDGLDGPTIDIAATITGNGGSWTFAWTHDVQQGP